MNFADFQQFREKLLRERRNVIDCAETNLYRALARLLPPSAPPPSGHIHRCHLAAEWAERFGISSGVSHRALVSCGVRDSLALILHHYAAERARLWLPADNYPVYGELARAAGLTPQEFATLPEPVWPDAASTSSAELIVVTNPLKPRGRWLNAHDVATLETWLAASPRRRLVLDAVYTFTTCFHPTTLQLVATGQTILLHSLTKAWLQPRLFGVALVPESDAHAFMPIFRAQPPPQLNLARARELLADHPHMPAVVGQELDVARKRLSVSLPPGFPTPALVDASGYFGAVTGGWSDLLERNNVLGLPATVFGSQCNDITILSSLSFLQ